MNNPCKLAVHQKEQRAIQIKYRISKQTHDIKLAESLSPFTKKLDEVRENTRNLGGIVEVSNTPQLAIENTPQPAIENNEGAMYDVDLETTLQNMEIWKTKILGFLKHIKILNEDGC